jgi:hypothetical protein
LLPCQKTIGKIYLDPWQKKEEEMCGENLTADLEQLTRDVHLLAKVFWLCTYHAYMGFAAVQPNNCEPFIYFDSIVTINYYLLGGNIWNIYLFNF